MKIGNITRQLSFEDIKPKKKIRYMQILDRLSEDEIEIIYDLIQAGYVEKVEEK